VGDARDGAGVSRSMARAALTRSRQPIDVRVLYALGYALVAAGRRVNGYAVRWANWRRA
jgi:hypothetical protein